MRQRRAAHPSEAKIIAKRHRDRNQAAIWLAKEAAKRQYEGLKSGPCSDCGGTFPPECMDWDHVLPGKVKGAGAYGQWVAQALLDEIGRCELVCANCHRIRTRQRTKGEAE